MSWHTRSCTPLLALALTCGWPGAAVAQEVAVVGTPVLHVATPQPGGTNQPVAWVTFLTRRRIDPRMTVAAVDARSGRSFRGGTANCVRSTLVDDDGRSMLRPGRHYVVELFSRAGTGSTQPRTLVSKRTLTARAFAVSPGARRAPDCATGRPAFTPTVAFRAGVRAFARIEDARVKSISVRCRPNPRVGDVRSCTGSFRLRRAGRTATYVLTARAATFRNTPGSIEYRVHARTADRVPGLPASVGGLAGFYTR